MRISMLIILLFLIGCAEEAAELKKPKAESQLVFDAADWKLEVDGTYPKRLSMVDDILYTDKIRQLSKESALSLLGEANKVVDEYYYYTISQESIGMWPLKTKTLVVKFTENGSVEWIKLHG